MQSTLHLLYDFLQVRGGAEAVTLRLRDVWPDAEVLVASVDRSQFSPIELERVRPLLAGHSSRRAVRIISAVRAFASLPKQPTVEAVLYSGHYAPLAWRSYPRARRVLYLHSPPLPFVFDSSDPALHGTPARLRPWFQALMRPLAHAYRTAIDATDVIVANSQQTADAFRRRFDRDCEIISPPIDPAFFAVTGAPKPGCWLSFARHEPRKRLDLLIDAFRLLPDRQLWLAGEGSQTSELRRYAAGMDNVTFLGARSVDDLCALLEQACGTIHLAQDEPFGLVVVESLAAGRPVITSGRQGAADVIRQGQNGWQVEQAASPERIADAIRACENASPSAQACRASVAMAHLDSVASSLAALLDVRGASKC